MSNKTELLKKIKELSKRGADGERENAQAALIRLMAQCGVSESDIEEEQREIARFRYREQIERRLLAQIIYMVTEMNAFRCFGASGRELKELAVDCTAAERLEIEFNYEFFKSAMYEELDIFFRAFVNKNDLFPSDDNTSNQNKPCSQEEIERRRKISMMMGGMERHILRKALTTENE